MAVRGEEPNDEQDDPCIKVGRIQNLPWNINGMNGLKASQVIAKKIGELSESDDLWELKMLADCLSFCAEHEEWTIILS